MVSRLLSALDWLRMRPVLGGIQAAFSPSSRRQPREKSAVAASVQRVRVLAVLGSLIAWAGCTVEQPANTETRTYRCEKHKGCTVTVNGTPEVYGYGVVVPIACAPGIVVVGGCGCGALPPGVVVGCGASCGACGSACGTSCGTASCGTASCGTASCGSSSCASSSCGSSCGSSSCGSSCGCGS
jgi:hypothetical protein